MIPLIRVIKKSCYGPSRKKKRNEGKEIILTEKYFVPKGNRLHFFAVRMYACNIK